MSVRLSALALLVLVPFAGCTWEGRPDGAAGVHTDSDGYFDDGTEPVGTPLGGGGLDSAPAGSEIVEPLSADPAPLPPPAPAAGTEGPSSSVDAVSTPESDQ